MGSQFPLPPISTFNAIDKVELREGIEGYLRKTNQF